jgi:hypothetical protein
MKKYHEIEDLKFSKSKLVITIDGKVREFSLTSISKKLSRATPELRSQYEISPSGYGISWPSIDEDLSIDGLLGVVHSRKRVKKSA